MQDYKREGHKEEVCWFLHLELRPKGRGRGGGYRGGRWRQEEQREEKKVKRILGATNERVKRVEHNPSLQTKEGPTDRFGETTNGYRVRI
jgi:hypothetical protein